ncbi:transmembrane 9 super member 2 [Mortierella antarctica]|nr:transmembrane 9 super member 2 [Mortierella antarctica]
MVGLVALWFLVSTPLSVMGSYMGFQRPKIENPVRANQIPRQIPEQLYFILNSIWFHKIYYVFGFLFLVFGILILMCAEVTILMCYFQLCAEDYHWWWRAFFTSGASALYIFGYSIMYYFSTLQIKSFTSMVLYFGWTAIMSMMFFVLSGAIGFFSTFMFVRKIYGSIKID